MISIIAFFLFFPLRKIIADTTTNAGFVPGNIWYSKDPFEEGDQIKIYTLVFNPDTRKFSGTIDFFDGSTILGTKNFSVAGNGTETMSVNWTVTVGNHQIFAQIKNAKFLTSSGTYVDANITDSKTATSSRTVANKAIAQNISNGISAINQTFNNALNTIQNIGNTVGGKIPSPVASTATSTGNMLENVRKSVDTSLSAQEIIVQGKIKSLNSEKAQTKNTVNANIPQKPFYYVELFFLTIFDFIFKYTVVFYAILVLAIFFILRYIWGLFF